MALSRGGARSSRMLGDSPGTMMILHPITSVVPDSDSGSEFSSSWRGSPNWRSNLRRKSEAEMERARVIKVQRTLIRLKHSLAADEELNEVLPDTLSEFDKAIAGGQLKQIQSPKLELGS